MNTLKVVISQLEYIKKWHLDRFPYTDQVVQLQVTDKYSTRYIACPCPFLYYYKVLDILFILYIV